MGQSFNLVTDKWLPVMRHDGTVQKVGIREALTEAGEIREIVGLSPLDTISVYRFLLAVLQWCKSSPTEVEIGEVKDAVGVPPVWLARLVEHEQRFELLGDGSRFYQDVSALSATTSGRKTRPKRAKSRQDVDDGFPPAISLIAEVPSGTNIAHFRHTRDGRDGLCPACCALALIRLSAFASASAHGAKMQKPAGINGGTPVYRLCMGKSLLNTLLQYWPMKETRGDMAGWMAERPPPREEIGCLAGLTWRPRTAWLEQPVSVANGERCAYCGDATRPLVRRMAYRPGWPRPFEKEAWPDDPHRLTVPDEESSGRGKPKQLPVVLPPPSASVETHARFWRKAYLAILSGAVRGEGGASGGIRCFGPAANKALYQDSRAIGWFVPTSGLSPESAATAAGELRALNQFWATPLMKRVLPRKADQRPEIRAALSATSARFEPEARAAFESLVKRLSVGGTEGSEAAVGEWRADVERVTRRQLRVVLSVLQSGSALRRRERGRALDELLPEAMTTARKEGPKGGTRRKCAGKGGDNDAE